MNPQAEQFFQIVRLENSRVQYPEDVIFFCGGEISRDGNCTSFRQFLYDCRRSVFVENSIVLAEQAAAAFDSRVYEDLMEFERYIASVSRIVLLISESPGSIAELGAFSQITEIRSRLLVFLHSFHYAQNSFVKDGPVRSLENRKEESVWEFDWVSDKDGVIDKRAAELLIPAVKTAVSTFKRRQPRTEKFDSQKIGHLILLVGGVIQSLACCKIREIGEALKLLGYDISEKEIKRIIFCLKLFGWVRSVKRETTYYIYRANSESFIFKDVNNSFGFDPTRKRFDIVRGYPDDDPRISVLETTPV